MAKTLAQTLDRRTREGALYEKLNDDKVRCYACGYRCLIFNGHRGICQVRYNENGALRVPWGYVGGLQSDPIEKKPFYHVLPGRHTLTFGMLGCDYHCPYCQNWLTSQTLRDPDAGINPRNITPQEMVNLAQRHGAKMVTSSYNEPLITAEWAVDIFELAREAGLRTAFVSNGNATREVLEYLRPWTDCYKIDLKSMDDKNYRQLGGVLDHVLRTIEMVHEMGFWMEIVTLVVPGWNDSAAELRAAAEFIAGVSPDIPWHVTAFHKDYKMRDPANTTVEHLVHAAEIGREAGLNYVYAGNLPGRVGRWENTYYPNCDALLVERHGYFIQRRRVTSDGQCPDCGHTIAGIWA